MPIVSLIEHINKSLGIWYASTDSVTTFFTVSIEKRQFALLRDGQQHSLIVLYSVATGYDNSPAFYCNTLRQPGQHTDPLYQ